MTLKAGAVALVTGAAGGLGSEIARVCALRGAHLMLTDLDVAGLERVRNQIRGAAPKSQVEIAACDVRRFEAVEALAQASMRAFGRIDYLFNNAGVDLVAPLWETTEQDWELTLGVNVLGVAWGIRAFTPIMLKQGAGHIVNIASGAGLMSSPGQGAYCASKAAVIAMTECFALEMKRIGAPIKTTVVAPAFVPTAILARHDDTGRSDLAREFGLELRKAVESAKATADVVAARIIAAVENGDFVALPHQGIGKHFGLRAEALRQGKTVYDAFAPEV